MELAPASPMRTETTPVGTGVGWKGSEARAGGWGGGGSWRRGWRRGGRGSRGSGRRGWRGAAGWGGVGEGGEEAVLSVGGGVEGRGEHRRRLYGLCLVVSTAFCWFLIGNLEIEKVCMRAGVWYRPNLWGPGRSGDGAPAWAGRMRR